MIRFKLVLSNSESVGKVGLDVLLLYNMLRMLCNQKIDPNFREIKLHSNKIIWLYAFIWNIFPILNFFPVCEISDGFFSEWKFRKKCRGFMTRVFHIGKKFSKKCRNFKIRSKLKVPLEHYYSPERFRWNILGDFWGL